MPLLVAAGQRHGKSHLIREWLVPTLLCDPTLILPAESVPAAGFKIALVDDPPRPETGAMFDGQRFDEVSEFTRVKERKRVCCFSRAERDALIGAAVDCRGAVVVFDEIDRRMPAGDQPYKAKGPYSLCYNLVEEPRHYGLIAVGGVRALKRVHKQVRENAQVVWLGNLADPDDRRYAADMIGIDVDELAGKLPPRVFLEWRRETNAIERITILKGNRCVVR